MIPPANDWRVSVQRRPLLIRRRASMLYTCISLYSCTGRECCRAHHHFASGTWRRRRRLRLGRPIMRLRRSIASSFASILLLVHVHRTHRRRDVSLVGTVARSGSVSTLRSRIWTSIMGTWFLSRIRLSRLERERRRRQWQRRRMEMIAGALISAPRSAARSAPTCLNANLNADSLPPCRALSSSNHPPIHPLIPSIPPPLPSAECVSLPH